MSELYIVTISKTLVLVKVFRTKKAIANGIKYPGQITVRREIRTHCPWVTDRRFYKPGDYINLYWNGYLFIEKTVYEGMLDNLQKGWRKVEAETEVLLGL